MFIVADLGPQVHVVRQPEKSGSLEHTSSVSQSYRLQDTEMVASPQVHLLFLSFSHLTIEREPVGTAQVHSDLNKLSEEAAAEQSFSFSEDCEDSRHSVCVLPEKRKTDRITSLYRL